MFTLFVKLFALSLIVFQLACTRAVDATNEILIDASGFNNKLGNSAVEVPILTIFNAHFDGKVITDERRCPAMNDESFPVADCPAFLFGQAVDFGGVDFPSGKNIIIQVVIATKDSTGNINFYFKGKEVVLASGENTMVFNTSEFNVVEGASAQGEVIGFVPDYSGVAGRLVGGFKPDPNQPEFRLFSSVFAGGHFNIFMPAGVKMTFKVLDPKNSNSVKLVLFENQTLDEIKDSIATDSVSAIAVGMPKRFRWWSGDGAGEFDPAETSLIGFFNIEGSKLVAKNDANFLLNFNASSDSFDSDMNGENTYYYCSDYTGILSGVDVLESDGSLKSICSNYLNIDPSAGVVSLSTAAIVRGRATPSGCSPLSGETFGVYGTNKLCYNLDLTHLGGENSFTNGFFQELPSIPANDGFVHSEINSNGDIAISYAFLPGMGQIISGAVTFLLSEQQEGMVQDPINGGVNCTELAMGSGVPGLGVFDFKVYDPIPAFKLAKADFKIHNTVTFPNDNSVPEPMVAVCPYIAAADGLIYFTNNGVLSRISNYISSHTGPPSSFATKVVLEPIWPHGSYEDTACVPVQLRSVDDTYSLAELSDAGTVSVGADIGSFYQDDTCNTTTFSSLAVSGGDRLDERIYYKAGSGNTGNMSSTITLSGAINGLEVVSFGGIAINTSLNAASAFEISHDFPNIVEGFCEPFEVSVINANGDLASNTSASPGFNLVVNTGNIDFYPDQANCDMGSGMTNTFYITGASYPDTITIWAKANSTASVDLTYSGLDTVNIPTFTPSSPPPVAGVDILLHGTNDMEEHYFTGLCLPMYARFYAADGKDTLGDNSVINLNVPANISLYTNNDCSSPTSSVTATTGVREKELYYKIDSIGDFAITASGAFESRGGDLKAVDQSQSFIGLLPGYNSVGAASCSLLKVGITDSSGNLLDQPPYSFDFSYSMFNLTFDDVSGSIIGGDSLYDNGTCNGAVINAGGAATLMYSSYKEFSYNGLSSGSNVLNLNFLISEPGFMPLNSSLNVNY